MSETIKDLEGRLCALELQVADIIARSACPRCGSVNPAYWYSTNGQCTGCADCPVVITTAGGEP